jgi:hypothetical protein
MNIFIIHSGRDKVEVDKVKTKIIEGCKASDDGKETKANILVLEYNDKKRKIWKPEAKRLMKLAQMILYVVGEDGHESGNINWELREALRQKKTIVVYRLNENYELNKVLIQKAPFTLEKQCVADEVLNIDELCKIIKKYDNNEDVSLLHNDMDANILFEQYKMFSETSEALVNRRQNVNNFYITANTALITIAATAFSLNGDMVSKLIITIVLTLPGILLNQSWTKILESYGIINSSKMRILSMMEEKLAASTYDAEWQVMSNKYNAKHYVSFTDGEKRIPNIFIGVYIAVDCVCILTLIFIIMGYI